MAPFKFEYLRAQTAAFESVATWVSATRDVGARGAGGSATVLRVSHDFFDVVGSRPSPGRAFSGDEQTPGGPDVAVITDACWTARFGGDPGVVGSTLMLDDRAYTIVGVMPPAFEFPEIASSVDAILPLALRADPGDLGANYSVIGRVRAGLDRAAVQADLDRIFDAAAARAARAVLRRGRAGGRDDVSGDQSRRRRAAAVDAARRGRRRAAHRVHERREPVARPWHDAAARAGDPASHSAHRARASSARASPRGSSSRRSAAPRASRSAVAGARAFLSLAPAGIARIDQVRARRRRARVHDLHRPRHRRAVRAGVDAAWRTPRVSRIGPARRARNGEHTGRPPSAAMADRRRGGTGDAPARRGRAALVGVLSVDADGPRLRPARARRDQLPAHARGVPHTPTAGRDRSARSSRGWPRCQASPAPRRRPSRRSASAATTCR